MRFGADPRHAGQSKAAARSRLLLALEQPRKLEAWVEAVNFWSSYRGDPELQAPLACPF